MNNLEILYEDNHIIVVIKKPNIPSQEDSSKDLDLLNMVKNYVKVKYNKPGNVYIGLVHRLDRPVSGIMVFARSSKAASRLNEQIKNKEFKKEYLAVINGIIKEDRGEFKDKLEKLSTGNTIVSNNGKESELDFEVIERNIIKQLSLVKIRLKTGRHHQIRVQFSSRGYPLYGDQRYGKLDKKQIALHAYSLSFLHPISKERLTFKNLPQDREGFNEFKINNII